MLDLKEEELLAIKYYIMFSVYNGYPNDSYVKIIQSFLYCIKGVLANENRNDDSPGTDSHRSRPCGNVPAGQFERSERSLRQLRRRLQ